MDILLCDKPDCSRFHKPECVLGECAKCKGYPEKLRAHYREAELEKNVVWNHWERKVFENGKAKRVLVTKNDNLSVLLEEFIKDVCEPTQGTSFVCHLFTALWQYKQYDNIKKDLPEGWVLAVFDFAKNRSVFYQDEIKEAFFGQNQITVHPIVMYYKNASNQLVKDSLICISEDRKHDFHLVKVFTDLAKEHLNRSGVPVHRIVIFSDGCSCQYKCRGAFADYALTNMPLDRNFYGSEHGKGESDGETGVINRAMDRAIVGRSVVIQTAADMHQWCNTNLVLDEDLTKRHFRLVTEKEINRVRPYTDVKTLKGCRKLHQFQAVPTQPYVLKVRELSCFCKFCKIQQNGKCLNKDYVGSFSNRKLVRKPNEVSVEEKEEVSNTLDILLTEGFNDQNSPVGVDALGLDAAVGLDAEVSDGLDSDILLTEGFNDQNSQLGEDAAAVGLDADAVGLDADAVGLDADAVGLDAVTDTKESLKHLMDSMSPRSLLSMASTFSLLVTVGG